MKNMKNVVKGRFKLSAVALALFAAVCLCFGACTSSNGAKGVGEYEEYVAVSSFAELMPYLKRSGVHVTMAPGTYRVTAKEVRSGAFPSEIEIKKGRITKVLLLVEGSDSYYDFTDVVMEVEGAISTQLEAKYWELANLLTLGNRNVVKGLKIVDIARATDAPSRGYVNIIMDGSSNRIEDVEVNSTGSYPYGYGELFGKGGKNVIRHKKHSCCLVRGYRNHVLNCKIIHAAYGHCLFMQGADEPLIEGCYIQSFMTTTDKVLAEKGGAAARVGYMTYFGYPTPAGYTIALSEEGIRAYNGGTTMIDGVVYERGTSNVTVKDCFVKNARAGVTLSHATGRKYVENTTVIGCERAFSIGTGEIVNCRADAQYGPVLNMAYGSDRGTVADITILPNCGEAWSGNGSGQVATIIGHDHKIIFRRGPGLTALDPALEICVGGNKRLLGDLGKEQDFPGNNIEIINETGYPLVLDDNTTGVTGCSVGRVINHGTDNHVRQL